MCAFVSLSYDMAHFRFAIQHVQSTRRIPTQRITKHRGHANHLPGGRHGQLHGKYETARSRLFVGNSLQVQCRLP